MSLIQTSLIFVFNFFDNIQYLENDKLLSPFEYSGCLLQTTVIEILRRIIKTKLQAEKVILKLN